MRRTMAWLLAFGMASAAGAAEPAKVGSSLAPRTLEDQYGEAHSLDESVRIVVFHRDMQAGDLLKAALADTSGEQLAELGVAYLADIAGMPRLVARLFALPAMRRRAYPMWLDRDGTQTADLPSQPGRVTVLRLELLKVTAVEFLEAAPELRAALGLEAPGEAPGAAER